MSVLGDGSLASSCWWSVYSVVVALNNYVGVLTPGGDTE